VWGTQATSRRVRNKFRESGAANLRTFFRFTTKDIGDNRAVACIGFKTFQKDDNELRPGVRRAHFSDGVGDKWRDSRVKRFEDSLKMVSLGRLKPL
jgi:hypothetical protein